MKKPYLVGKYKPSENCMLRPNNPMYCIVEGSRGGIKYVCPMFNNCPIGNRVKIEEKLYYITK